jgi:hypothetical protein
MPISEMFEEKNNTRKRIKWTLGCFRELRETRKFRHSYQKKENDFESLFRLFPNIKTIVFNGKESHKYFCKNLDK